MDKKIISFLDSYLIIILFVVKEKTRNQSCNLIFLGAPILISFPSKANVCVRGRGPLSNLPTVKLRIMTGVKTGDNTATSLPHYATPHTWSAVSDCNPISITHFLISPRSKLKRIFFSPVTVKAGLTHLLLSNPDPVHKNLLLDISYKLSNKLQQN